MQTENNKDRNVVVSHVGRRDSYELAYALTRSGCKVHLATDFYYNTGGAVASIAKFFFRDAVLRRYRPDLNIQVHTTPLLLLLDLLERFVPRNKVVNRLRGYSLGRLSRKLVRKYSASVVFFYYNSGLKYFPKINKSARLVLFQMHPHPNALKRIYAKYLSRRPSLERYLVNQEEEMTDDRDYLSALSSEAFDADLVICPSSFVKKSLLDAGICESRIRVVPYGCLPASSGVAMSWRPPGEQSFAKINLCFVGQFVVRKSVYELLEFIARFDDATLTVYTRDAVFAQQQVIDWLGFSPSNLSIIDIRNDEELWQGAARSDFLILPSVAEGFGLVILEAMRVGLPVIASPNSAGTDIIQHMHDGINMDGYMSSDILKSVKLAISIQANWLNMRINAKTKADAYSWNNFRAGIANIQGEMHIIRASNI